MGDLLYYLDNLLVWHKTSVGRTYIDLSIRKTLGSFIKR